MMHVKNWFIEQRGLDIHLVTALVGGSFGRQVEALRILSKSTD
jgi:hypothetical protein